MAEETPAETPEEKPEAEAPPEEKPEEKPEAAEKEPDWKAESRKHERRAKAERKAREDLEAKLKDRDDANKSEQEKALEKAREEAKAEATTAANEEIRRERLTAAVARLAAGKFADVDDAIRLLDVEGDEIFDEEGKVQTDALGSALDELLERKPHLKASPGKPSGDADAGKGAGATKSVEDMSVEEHLKQLQSTR